MATPSAASARVLRAPGEAAGHAAPCAGGVAGVSRAASRTTGTHPARRVTFLANDRSRAEQVLDMQRRLLEQIEERKRLHALLMENLNGRTPPGHDKAGAVADLPPPPTTTTTPTPAASSVRAPSSRKAGGASSRARSSSSAAAAEGAPAQPPLSSTAAVAAAAAARRAAVAAGSATAPMPEAAPMPPPPPPPMPEAVPSFVDLAADAAAAEACVLPTAEALLENVATPDTAHSGSAASSSPSPEAGASTPPEAPPPEEAAPKAPLCKERLNVVMVAMECAPWSKTGGLGDVAGSLPKALAARGHRTMCIAPRYANYGELWETGIRIRLRVCGSETEVGFFHGYLDGVDYVFVDHPAFHAFKDRLYGGTREELQFRCALLCQAALEAPWTVPCGGVPYGDESLVFLANDWHTALLPVFLQGFYRDHGKLTFARCCLVIHNMAHQGRGPMTEFDRLGLPGHWRDAFLLDDPFGGICMNIFKAGILAAHKLVAVSEGYAWECATDLGGWGLAPVLRSQGAKLSGIVNGIDTAEWDPSRDPHLQADGYVNYTPDEAGLAGKAACKAALQKELGLPVRADVPLIGFIGRLDYQKGVDLICQSADHLVGQGAQLVLLGTGTADLENALRSLEARHRNAARGWVGFSVAMAHRITAGADLLLMPSRFEPCGLNQLYAMRYGTVPVVHAVGGLRDTVKPFNPFENTGTGWTFSPADAGRMNDALGNAMYTYRSYPDSFRGIQLRGMAQDLSWEVAAAKYEDVMLGAKYTW